MTVRLLVRQRSEAGGADKPVEVLLDDPLITLGRDKACQVVLGQQAVSRTHARISCDGALFFVEDLGSAYGTQVNGQDLPKGEKRLLRNGDVIAIAQFDVTFDRIAEVPRDAIDNKTSRVARHVVKDVMRGLATGESPYFRLMNGPAEGQKIEIADAQEITFGRDEAAADIVFKDDLVSRVHAKVRRDWSGTHVEDLESRNGIKVNRKRVTRRTLRDRDEIEIGATRLLYLDPSEVREAPVVLPDEDAGEETHHSQHDPPPPQASEAAPEAPAEPEAPPPAEAAAVEEPPADALPEPEPEPEADPYDDPEPRADGLQAGLMGKLRIKDPRMLLPIAAAALLGLLALVILIALFAGA